MDSSQRLTITDEMLTNGLNMKKVQEAFKGFIVQLETKLKVLDITPSDYPIDHVCYRVKDSQTFGHFAKLFKSYSILYTKRVFHGRDFYLFVLKQPLSYQKIQVPYLEFSQPGGSDLYETGFQHIEFLTDRKITELSSKKTELSNLLFSGKYGDEFYLKWSDKAVLKVTSVPSFTKALSGDNTQIYLNKSYGTVFE